MGFDPLPYREQHWTSILCPTGNNIERTNHKDSLCFLLHIASSSLNNECYLFFSFCFPVFLISFSNSVLVFVTFSLFDTTEFPIIKNMQLLCLCPFSYYFTFFEGMKLLIIRIWFFTFTLYYNYHGCICFLYTKVAICDIVLWDMWLTTGYWNE